LVVTLVSMWAFVLNQVRYERALVEKTAHADAMNLATAFEAHVRSVISHMDSLLLHLRDDLPMNAAQIEKRFNSERHLYGPNISQAAAIDRNGLLRYSNLAPVTGTVDLSDREHFQIHRDNPALDRLFISRPVLGRVSGIWTIQFTRPVRVDGQFAGVLVLSVPTTHFSDYYKQIELGPSGNIALVGMDGGVRALASQGQLGTIPANVRVPADRPFFNPSGADTGFYRGISVISGDERLTAFRRIAEHGVVVLVQLAPADFLAVANARERMLLLSAGLVSLLLLATAVGLLLLTRRHFRDAAALREAHRQLRKLVASDSLTGAASRRHFVSQLETELRRAQRYQADVCLLMLDIDHFKQVNDTYGHPVGDDVLREFVVLCGSVLRGHDLIGRLGGEEFAVMLPHTDLEGACCVAEKLRLAIANAAIATARGDIRITTSVGVAISRPGDEDATRLVERADNALYAAKKAGRNRVCADSSSSADNPLPVSQQTC
jgi:diguanylate cyclase (GGDEF)-like protein